MHFALYSLAALLLSTSTIVAAEDCSLTTGEPITFDLAGLNGVSFVGLTPKITRFVGEPMIKITGYSLEPVLEVMNGKLMVSTPTCQDTLVDIERQGTEEEGSIASKTSKPKNHWYSLLTSFSLMMGFSSSTTSVAVGWSILGALALAPSGAQAQLTCDHGKLCRFILLIMPTSYSKPSGANRLLASICSCGSGNSWPSNGNAFPRCTVHGARHQVARL